MSVTDPSADPVQPEPGQGEEGSGSPYDSYLSRIPEQVRGEVEPVFKDWDANVSRKFQEAADFRKEWEPYQELGVQQVPPDEMQWHLTFRDALQNNPQAVVDWAREFAQERGISLEQAVQEAQQQDTGLDEFGSFDQQALQTHLAPLQQQMEQITAYIEQQQQQAALSQAQQQVEKQLDELKAQHPNEYVREEVELFLDRHRDKGLQAVQAAFADAQKWKAQLQKQFVESKANVPPGAEHGGGADGSVEPAKTLPEARAQAMARFEQMRQQ